MILNPAVQQKAHDELDSVVGRTRLPNFEDRPNLPFVTAIFLESMRWRPVTPLGMLCLFTLDDHLPERPAIAHASRNDDVYNGYFIPGGELLRQTLFDCHCFDVLWGLGSTVLANVWYLGHGVSH